MFAFEVRLSWAFRVFNQNGYSGILDNHFNSALLWGNYG
jgi:hypothetical protein